MSAAEKSAEEQKHERLVRRANRERSARKQAESLLEAKSRELYEANQALVKARDELEDRVAARTRELTRANERLRREVQDHVQTMLALTEARDQAIAASRVKSQFVAHISHEFRTPLSAILGYTELLIEDLEFAQEGDELDLTMTRQDVTNIREAGHHLLALIGELLDLAKIESGKLELVLEQFSASVLIDELGQTMRPLVEASQRLELHVEPGIEDLRTDRIKLRQVLINLVGNALKFTPEGTVRVHVMSLPHEEGPRVCFEVRDDGVGMTEEAQQRVFGAFEQAEDTTHHDFGGTGLGLTLCKRLVGMLDGTIEVASALGSGTTFTVIVPLVLAEHELSMHDVASEPVVYERSGDERFE